MSKQFRIFDIPTNLFPSTVDKYMNAPVLFTVIVIAQGLFGGLGLIQTPKAITDLAKNPVFRYLFVSAIAYSASGDIETALFSTIIFKNPY